MKANRARWPIATMARLLQVSTSGYYAWLVREASKQACSDAQLLARIRTLHASSRGTYGAPRIHVQLAREGVHVGRKRVARLMRMAGLCGASRRRWKVTTCQRAGARRAPDLVRRHFSAEACNILWVADATYVPTGEGFLYLTVVLDVFSLRIVGWAMSSHLYTELMLRALDMALDQRRAEGVIHRSDQGCQGSSRAIVVMGQRARFAFMNPYPSVVRSRSRGRTRRPRERGCLAPSSVAGSRGAASRVLAARLWSARHGARQRRDRPVVG
jgi:putative transposase